MALALQLQPRSQDQNFQRKHPRFTNIIRSQRRLSSQEEAPSAARTPKDNDIRTLPPSFLPAARNTKFQSSRSTGKPASRRSHRHVRSPTTC